MPSFEEPATGQRAAQAPPWDMLRRGHDESPIDVDSNASPSLRDAVAELDVLAGELVMISQRAAEAAAIRGDEIDGILRRIRDARQEMKTTAR